jgi:hypothetical protein
MYERVRSGALAILKTPAEPRPPMGDPASLRVFNAGLNYYRLRMFRWTLVQLLALGGIIFWTAFLFEVERTAKVQAAERANAGKATGASQPKHRGTGEAKASSKERFENWKLRLTENVKAAAREPGEGKDGTKSEKRGRYKGWDGFKQTFVEIALLLPTGTFALIWGVKLLSLMVYLVQLVVTYVVRRLDYEMRWYMVTDRSLRLRHGVWKVSEATMSFANIQQVVVSQGPLQRLLGLADVKVTSAGGGGGGGQHSNAQSEMHTGLFHSVTNATEIRDLIVERLRRFRETGLGDPDEKVVSTMGNAAARSVGIFSSDTMSAARELAAEAQLLRAAIVARSGSAR